MKMATGFEDQAKVAALPQEGIHCFPASGKQVKTRRIVSAILALVFIAIAVCGFVMGDTNYVLIGIGILGLLITVLVFAQSFLIANYRVAVDYNDKKLVLRYRFSTIEIPFENFDARDGEPDMAEELLDKSTSAGEKKYYLVLDDVFQEACFQTSNKDLASNEDFFKLKEECLAIAEAYGARNDENAIKPIDAKHGGIPVGSDDRMKEAGADADEADEAVDSVLAAANVAAGEVGDAIDEAKEEVVSEAAEKVDVAEEIAEEAAEAAEEAAEEAKEAADAAGSEE